MFKKIIDSFAILGDFLTAEPYGNGHTNNTYRVKVNQAGRTVHYLIQQINDEVFQDPEALMMNIDRICRHMDQRVAWEGLKDTSRRILTLIPSRDGLPWFQDEGSHYWRCYLFIEGAVGHEVVSNPMQAREAARCFGEYLRLLEDFPGAPLHEEIPNFHDTPKCLNDLLETMREDTMGLAKSVGAELSFFLERQENFDKLIRLKAAGDIPERVTHNNTRLNNVLIDNRTHKAMCVIDLDTSMPGFSPCDFGGLVRSTTCPVPEDHPISEEVTMDLEIFTALAEGFLEPGLSFLNDAEIDNLLEGGRLVTMEVGMRFLTDYLQGSHYFRTAYPEHNLVRCQAQIALVKSIEDQWDQMRRVIEKIRESKKPS